MKLLTSGFRKIAMMLFLLVFMSPLAQAINLSDLIGVNDSAQILDFSATTNYHTNQVVYHHQKLYRANTAVTAGTFNPVEWDVLKVFRGEFLADGTNSYQAGDVVWGTDDKIYRVTTDFTPVAASAITDATNQSNLQLISGADGGIKYDPTKSYTVGDLIESNGEILINITATSGTVSAPHTYNAAEWRNWRVANHFDVADDTALFTLAVGNTAGDLHINDTAYRQDNETLYRYTATDGTNDALADWTVIYDFNRKLDQSEFEQRFGAKSYNTASTYKTNELVIQGGILYRANTTVGAADTNGNVTTPAGAFNAANFDVLINISGLTPIGTLDMSSDPGIGTADATNQNYYYIVTDPSATAVSYADLPASTEYSAGDMIINLDGANWTQIKNTTRWASKAESEVNITLLNDDGSEITSGSITNVKVITPLRALQQLLHNRLASLFQLRDDTDETKKIQFSLSGITTGTTRVLTIPDEDIVIAGRNRIGIRDYNATETYIINQVVKQGGVVWRNITPVTTPEAFDSAKWELVSSNTADWQTITADPAPAVAFGQYVTDSSGGVFNITLPAAPAEGDIVTVKDGNDTSVNNVTILRNGNTILQQTEDFIIDIRGSTTRFVYVGGTWTVEFDAPDPDAY